MITNKLKRRPKAGGLTNAKCLDFCIRLDAAIGLSLGMHEYEFIGRVMERNAKCKGNLKFFGGQYRVIQKMMDK